MLGARGRRGRETWHLKLGTLNGWGRGGKGSDKTVAPAVHRLDITWLLRIVPQGSAQLLNIRGQRSVTDHRLQPDSGKQVILGYQLPRMHNKIRQRSKRFRRQLHFLFASP